MLISLLLMSTVFGFDQWDQDVEKYLNQLHQAPKEVMNSYPHEASHSYFTQNEITSKKYIELKIKSRARITQKMSSPWRRNDKPESFVDHPEKMLKNLKAIEEAKLLKGQLEMEPWSDDYWPIADGQIAKRYLDPEWPYGSWKELKEYVSIKPYTAYLTPALIMFLSPSEKYDLLVGDSEMKLTKQMWKEGERFWNEYGDIERWMGLCHGWAPASFMLKTPNRTITMTDFTGKNEIPFTPSDLKALGTLLWAKGEYESRYIGGRCNSKEPTQDDNGRIMEDDCLDTNPGTWHMVVINQLGVEKRSFVLDATFDYQVWNQPAISYEYRYFQPQTKKSALKLQDAIVAVENFSDDIFKKFRSPKAKYIVGISMDFIYAVENSPSDMENQPTYTRKVKYLYDLELDENMNIVGGEWYNNHHPDFVWAPVKDARLYTAGDAILEGREFREAAGIDPLWRKALLENAYDGVPLGKIVERMFNLSN